MERIEEIVSPPQHERRAGKIMPSVIVRMRARLLFLPAVLTLLVSIHILLLVRLPTNGTASKSSSRVLVPLDTRSYEEQRPEITISNHHPQHQGVIDVHNISSVDYMACCGAGHRISKTAEAHYLSLQLGFALRSFWGFCDTSHPKEGQTEVFQYVNKSLCA